MKPTQNGIMVIMAHPDDAELWAGGTISIHSTFSSTYILVATRESLRKNEATKGAKILGANLLLEAEINVHICQKYIKLYKPEIIVTHNPNDFHFEHRNIYQVVLESIIRTVIDFGSPQKLYTCDTYNSITTDGKIEGKYIVDITSVYKQKIDALKCHKSQPLKHFVGMANRLSSYWGGVIGTERGEAFDIVPILGMLPSNPHL